MSSTGFELNSHNIHICSITKTILSIQYCIYLGIISLEYVIYWKQYIEIKVISLEITLQLIFKIY